MQVAKQLKRAPEGLLGPKRPLELRYVWDMFMSLHAGRGSSESGPNPLSYTEIKDWCDMCDVQLTTWELDLIKNLDAAFLNTDRRPANF
jgi:hypothetical protein